MAKTPESNVPRQDRPVAIPKRKGRRRIKPEQLRSKAWFDNLGAGQRT